MFLCSRQWPFIYCLEHVFLFVPGTFPPLWSCQLTLGGITSLWPSHLPMVLSFPRDCCLRASWLELCSQISCGLWALPLSDLHHFPHLSSTSSTPYGNPSFSTALSSQLAESLKTWEFVAKRAEIPHPVGWWDQGLRSSCSLSMCVRVLWFVYVVGEDWLR